MREPPQRHVRRGAREAFGACQLDRRHPQPLDIAGMSNRAHGNSIVNLEKFLPRLPEGEEKDPVAVPESHNRAAAGQLRFNVFRAVRDRFNPAIRLFDHATLRLKTAAIFFSGKVVIPWRDTILITGKIFAFRSTPPVAVSDSAAVSSARNATVTASSSLNFASTFFPQLFS